MTESLLPAIILAGGLATRLRPITEKLPKALIDVNGKPFIAHQLRLLQVKGIKRVIISVGYLGEQIISYVGDGKYFGLSVDYSHDGTAALLGTAGAIKKALPLLGEYFFVIYGDSYLPSDYLLVQKTFFSSQKLALMTVFKNEGKWDKSNVEYDGKIIKGYDKQQQNLSMHYIDYGLGVFNKKAFDNVPEKEPSDLAVLYQLLLKKNQLAAFEATQRFYEVGSLAGIKAFQDYLVHRQLYTEKT